MENFKRPKPLWINEFSSNDSLHMFSELVEEYSTKSTFQEISSTKSTKESICDDAFRKAEVNEELDSSYQILHSLEAQISKLIHEKSKLTINNKKLQHEFKNAKLELKALELIDTAWDINKKLQEQKKALLENTQLFRKQKVRLKGLKCIVEEKCAELAQKEDDLSDLIENGKILKVRLQRLSNCKSLDISKLQVNLDVIHTNLEIKDACNVSDDFSKNELKDYLNGSLEKFKKKDRKELQRKIDELLEKYTEIEQKIAELKLNYQNSKRKIIFDHQRIKEDLIKHLKSKRQDLFTCEKNFFEKEKERYAHLIRIANEDMVGFEERRVKVESLTEYAAKMKKDLDKIYRKIKTKKKERFKISEAIDARGLEIDDILLEIDKIKALVMM